MNSTKLTSKFTSASGKYYENGAYHYHSDGCYEARSDGKYFTHYYANMGNVYREITKEEYDAGVAALKAVDGKPTKHWSRAVMKLSEEVREVSAWWAGWTPPPYAGGGGDGGFNPPPLPPLGGGLGVF